MMGSQKLYASYALPTIKVQRPPLPSNTIMRKCLIESLLTILEDPTTHIVLRAPLGCGKTVLLSQLDDVLTMRGWTTSWLRLDSFDSPTTLDAHLAMLEKVDLLIVDDAQHLEESSTETCLKLLSDDARIKQVLLAGKASLHLPNFRKDSKIKLFECEDLLFSAEDTSRFCASFAQRDCEDLAATLFELFSGWPLPTHFAMRELAKPDAGRRLEENLLAAFDTLGKLLASESFDYKEELPPCIERASSIISSSATDAVSRIISAHHISTAASSHDDAKRTLKSNYMVDNPLSNKEREVLRLTSNGLRPKQIVQELVISEQTVRTHLKSIYRKLGAHSRQEAVEQAIMRGLL